MHLTLSGQVHLDVEGDAKIQGRVDISAIDDSTAIYLGRDAGVNSQHFLRQWNTFLGFEAGTNNTSGSYNTFIGSRSGNTHTTSFYNTFLGANAGTSNVDGGLNTFLGYQAGRSNQSGHHNTFVGQNAGWANKGSDNTILGSQAGLSVSSGSGNLILGRYAGSAIVHGDSNICIGVSAGPMSDTEKKLFIDIVQSDEPLIHGDFVSNRATVHGNLNVKSQQAVLNMVSDGHANGSVLVLKNNLASPTFVGAINFENNVQATNGQIAYESDDELSFRVNGIDAFMQLSPYTHHIKMSNGATLTAGGVWTNACSKSLKNLRARIHGKQVLDKLIALPIYDWTYTRQPSEKHVGPTAEDFYSAFGLGNSDKTLSALDVAGVAVAAIQQLSQEIVELKREIEKLKHQK